MRIEKKHNYFYKIINLINGKYYYGIRSVDKLPDNFYMGSGKNIKKAIRKYGRENFVKEIIADYSTRHEVNEHERLVVTMELVLNENCYNLKTGGDNKFTFKHSEESKQKISEIQTGRSNFKLKGRKLTDEHKHKIKMAKLNNPLSNESRQKIANAVKNRKISDETRKKLSIAALNRTNEHKSKLSQAQRGEKNHRYGKKHTDEYKKQQSLNRSGGKSCNAKKCIVFGKIYECRLFAANDLKIPKTTLHRRIDSDNPKWNDYKNYEQTKD